MIDIFSVNMLTDKQHHIFCGDMTQEALMDFVHLKINNGHRKLFVYGEKEEVETFHKSLSLCHKEPEKVELHDREAFYFINVR